MTLVPGSAVLGAAGEMTPSGSAGPAVVARGGGSLSAMPSPVLSPPVPGNANPPVWTRDVQPWAVAQERARHEQALYMLGELAMFALMWHIEDLEAGLTVRCAACWTAEGSIAAAYGQGNQNRCPACYGTTFEGYKALIIRPAIFRDIDQDQRKQARGVTNTATTNIESTADFLVRTGDYCLRQTGDRFFLRVPRRTTLRTGFSSPWQAETAIDYVHAAATREDPASAAYLIFPDRTRLLDILQDPGRLPADLTTWDPALEGLG